MPRLVSVAVVPGSFQVAQRDVKDFAVSHFGGSLKETAQLASVFDQAQIDFRHLVMPLDWYATPRSFAQNNQYHLEKALELATQAIEKLLDQVSLQPRDIDALILVNSTGIANPTLESRLATRLGFPAHVSRLPLWGLGCAGGVAGLAQAWRHAKAFPRHRVIVITVELCSLTFQAQDYTTSNFVATALFADGVGVALVVGDEVEAQGQEIKGACSHLIPDTEDIMGWNVIETGLQVIFSQRIPGLVPRFVPDILTNFLSEHNLGFKDIDHFLLHPGGRRVLEAYEKALKIGRDRLDDSWQVLSHYGNMSSATVFFVLEQYLKEKKTIRRI